MRPPSPAGALIVGGGGSERRSITLNDGERTVCSRVTCIALTEP